MSSSTARFAAGTPGPVPGQGAAQLGPKFAELVQKRRSLSMVLTALILVIYFGFIFLVAFAPHFLAQPVSGVITLAFPVGLGVIVAAIVLTGVYVVRANGEFDRLNRDIVEGRR